MHIKKSQLDKKVMMLFAGMSRTKYGMLKNLYYGQKDAPGISWISGHMGVEYDEVVVVEANYAT